MSKGRTIRNLIKAAVLLLLGNLLWVVPAVAAEPVNDVRILIDISGSMKHNDPHNLRAPALRLITGLLPKGARAGVWTYGQWVNMLVPLGDVTADWQNRAQHASTEINSYGLFTNIEGAMDRATRDWKEPDANSRRSLIMLTDGFVDISKDPALNAAARDRIINKILPRLRDAKVKIYTIALSGEADHTLLNQLSAATDGWSEEADDSTKLQRIFLHLFEKATHPDTLPIVGNLVQVDGSIKEITFLVFRDTKGKPTELVTPDGKRFGANNAPSQARWHSDTGYDLITITQPEPGAWHVIGPEDNDNRVMVVTDLKLRTTRLPNNLSTKDTLYYFAQLVQGDTVIHRKDFLDLVKVTLHQQQQGGKSWDWQLLDDGKGDDMAAGDGTFSHKLSESIVEGRHEITLRVDGTTFQREQRQVINVHSHPVQATVTADASTPGHYILSVIPYSDMIVPDSMAVTAVVADSHDASKEITLKRSGPAEWQADLNDYTDPDGYQAKFKITGNHSGGKPISDELGPFKFTPKGTVIIDEPPQKKAEKPASETKKPEVKPEAKPEPKPAEKASAAEKQAKSDDNKINWFAVAWQTLLINVLLIGAGFFGYKRWRKSSKVPSTDIVEEEDD